MPEPKKISFAKVAGAGSSGPVTPATPTPTPPTASTEVVPPEASQPTNGTQPTDTRVAAPTQTALAHNSDKTFFFGDEEQEDDRHEEGQRLKYPHLNLVQPSSLADMKKLGTEGEFVFGRAINLGSEFKAVVIGFSRTFYREKVKYGGNTQGRVAFTLEEVATLGGTTNWSQSRENDKIESRKPWFTPTVKALLLIEQPEGADEGMFPRECGGKLYGLCDYELKSTAYDSFFIDLESKRKNTALFKGGFASRFVTISSVPASKKEGASLKPVVTVGDRTTDELLAFAKKAVS